MLKILKFTGLFLASLIITLAVWQYFLVSQFSFSDKGKFSGTNIYNPYRHSDSGQWIRANFHAHTNAWNGFTNGNGTPADVLKRFNQFGYDVIGISEYQKICAPGPPNSLYVPVYEHGYNTLKTHQQVIGAEHVFWYDGLFPQTLNFKQWILSNLRENDTEIVVLNHPAMRNGYTERDMQYLTGYNCMEVLNPKATSFTLWDAALTAGNPVFITANDDLHNIFKDHEAGRFCNWLNVKERSVEQILFALKAGNGYGMKTGFEESEAFEKRNARIKDSLPALKYLDVSGSDMIVEFTGQPKSIRFFADSGRLVKSVADSSFAAYKIRETDSYVRAAALYADGTEIYLNPVYRYKTDPLAMSSAFTVNSGKTFLFRAIGFIVLAGWYLFVLKTLVGLKSRKKLRFKIPQFKQQPQLGSI